MHKLSLLIGLSLICVSAARATTTYQFSVAGNARATGFANAAGTPTNGMRWGLVIDTAGDGFDNSLSGKSYEFFNNSVSGFISTANTGDAGGLSVATSDDYFFTPASLPTTATQTATGTDPGGVGGIVSAASAPNGNDGIIPGVTTGDKFAIIWFDSTPGLGTNFGLFTDPSFLLPASGTSVSFASVFAGSTADPAKPANLSFNTAVAIPEPSRALLFGFGALGLMFRRRRA